MFETGGWPVAVAEERLAAAHRLARDRTDIPVDPTGTAGLGNNRWEVGEQVEFSLDVKNDGTDPVTAAVVHVTPITAGITMLDDTATVGDLDPGISATTQPPHAPRTRLSKNVEYPGRAANLMYIPRPSKWAISHTLSMSLFSIVSHSAATRSLLLRILLGNGLLSV